MRVAVVSSPRSGNTWIRSVIAKALGWRDFAFHDFREVPEPLPADCLLQIHWNRETEFLRWLDERGFVVVSIARHPLDVLLSAVRYAKYVPDARRWLDGRTRLPVHLGKQGAASREFLDYCVSDEAELLLSVTIDWWPRPETIRMKYEDVVADPIARLTPIIGCMGGNADVLPAALEQLSIGKTATLHNWRGKPGHWSKFIVHEDATRIARRHQGVFEMLGYDVPEYFISRDQATENWAVLA